MVKNVFLIIFLTFYVTLSNAQEDEPLFTRAGFKVGLNYSNITGYLENTDARIRMHLGAVIEFPVSQRFYVQPEILYSAQGYKIEENGEENEISLNYLTLPIITKYYFTNTFSFETGPRLATLANATESEEDTPNEFFDTYSDFDFAWVSGVGYKAESGLFCQLHYNLGVSNIINTDIVDISSNTSLIQFSVGYLFKTKNNRRQEEQF